MEPNPSALLPRDDTGSYLHLKLKRFASKDELTMSYAVTTWNKTPHHAEIDMSPSNRSKCRGCHSTIPKGSLRLRLFLQCHKGCKQSAYFHGSTCGWEYPETVKLESMDELVGWERLPANEQTKVQEAFHLMKNKEKVKPVHSKKRTESASVVENKPQVSNRKRRKRDQVESKRKADQD